MSRVLCFIGFHKWTYTFEGFGRWCKCCPKKQEKDVFGWVDLEVE